jgi:hypothetical protein
VRERYCWLKDVDIRATNERGNPAEFIGMLRTDEAIIKALHAYAFTESKKRSVARAVIGMKISNTLMTESGKVGNDVFGLEERRPVIKIEKPSYAVVSEGSDRCLRAVVSTIHQISNTAAQLTCQVPCSS